MHVTRRATPARGEIVGRRPLDRSVVAALVAIVVAGALLRVVRLTHQSLWNDEVVTYISSAGSWWRVITQREENSNIPPLYYLVANTGLMLRRWLGVEAALRVPSVIAGVLSIPLLFAVVRRWLGDRVALLAAGLMAVSPFHIWYSQEARPYALLLLLSLVALLCIQIALVHPGAWGWKIAAAVATASTFYCHTVGLGFIAFAAVYVLGMTPAVAWGEPGQPGRWLTRVHRQWPVLWRSQWRDWAVTFSLVLVLCIPAAYRLISFPPTNSADTERPLSVMQLAYTLWSFAVGYSFGPSLAELHAPHPGVTLAHDAPIVVPVGLAIVGLTALGAMWVGRRHRRVAIVLALWFAFPLAFVAAGALVTVHPFNVRYAVISFLPAIVLLAGGLIALPTRGLSSAGVAGVLLVSAISLHGYYADPRYARDDNRGAAAFLAARARPGELVLAHRAYTAKDLRFYAAGTGARILPYPDEQHSLASRDADRDLAATVSTAPRFWLFLSRSTAEEDTVLTRFCARWFHRDSADSFTSTGVRLIACVHASTPGHVAVAPGRLEGRR